MSNEFNKSVGEKIRKLRTNLDMTQSQVAKSLGYTSSTTITKIESGAIDLTQSRLIAFSQLFHVPVEYFFSDEDRFVLPSEASVHRIPILGEIHCGEPTYEEEEFQGYVSSDCRCDFALRCKGDSMIGARIHDGDLVFIRRQETVENGQIAAVIIEDEATLKRVRFLPGGMVMLMAQNPKYEPIIADKNTSVRILGLAVSFQGKVI